MMDQASGPWFSLKVAHFPANGALIPSVSLENHRQVSFILYASSAENAWMCAPTMRFVLVKACIVSNIPIASHVESALSDAIMALLFDTAI
jgi:hypothetical protein